MTAKKQNPTTKPNLDSSSAPAPGRVPPQSLEAEMCTLGSMILDVDCVGDIIPLLHS